MPTIEGSVGRGGENKKADVLTVQKLLNRHDLSPLRALDTDSICGPATVGAIEHFQDKFVGMRHPDGRVDPGGRTLRELGSSADSGGGGEGNPSPGGDSASLSGAPWWRANQHRYPNSRRIEDLEGDFRDNAKRFIEALQAAQASVQISSTRRNATRAHLMHYSWRVANDGMDPARVPAVAGLNIEWDHGDIRSSRRGAREMVRLFNLAHIASLRSNHIRGTAIDMTIRWQGDLRLRIPDQAEPTVIRDGPRNGSDNTVLHDAGRKFGVRKLRRDPPHWSHNGR